MGRTIIKAKLSRREGEVLSDSNKHRKALARRNYPPGMHGPKRKMRLSNYGKQLRMTQRAKRMYGLREKQFKNLFKKAQKSHHDVSSALLELLEQRLDNVIYRLGFAETRAQARQLVNHAHFKVNGKKVNIPSFNVKINDEVTLKDSSESRMYFKDIIKIMGKISRPDWILWDDKEKKAKVLKSPNIEEVRQFVDAKLIVEYYSK